MSATGNSAGFTLVETLMVMLIVGLLAGVAMLTLPAASDPLRDEARVFAARAALGAQESVIAGTPVGLAIDARGYRFLQWREGRWLGVQTEPAFTPRLWPEGMAVALAVAGEQDPLPASPPAQPQVVYEAVGTATPFTATFVAGERRLQVAGDSRGRVAVHDGDRGERAP
jgi:general secretion pathway protein H